MAVEALLRKFRLNLASGSAAAAPIPPFDPADFNPTIKTRLLILQPTPFCNIDCDYCYLPNRASTARMSLATIQLAAQRLIDDGLVGPNLTVVWHAGEPLALPPAYYDEAIAALQERLGGHAVLTYSIQTNATLIDDRWCTLFKTRDIRVGVSVDGPAALHDAHRRTRSGKGTHDRVLRGMRCLQEQGIPFHVIAVVTPATFAQAAAFVDFFEAEAVHEIGCNFDEAEGMHQASSLVGHEPSHAAFMSYLLERSTAACSPIRIRELTTAYQLIAAPLPRYTWNGREWPDNSQVLPFALVNVAHDGDFSTFSPELLGQPSLEFDSFTFGNLAETGYLTAGRSERFQRVWSAIVSGIAQCESTCTHFGFCGGGAPANKLYENGSLASAETLYCRAMIKRPFDIVLAQLESARRQEPSTASPCHSSSVESN
jgi:uncharacterized protein